MVFVSAWVCEWKTKHSRSRTLPCPCNSILWRGRGKRKWLRTNTETPHEGNFIQLKYYCWSLPQLCRKLLRQPARIQFYSHCQKLCHETRGLVLKDTVACGPWWLCEPSSSWTTCCTYSCVAAYCRRLYTAFFKYSNSVKRSQGQPSVYVKMLNEGFCSLKQGSGWSLSVLMGGHLSQCRCED